MQTLKIIAIFALVAFMSIAGWQIGSSELANIELQDDMKDLASQLGLRVGLSPPSSDDEFRSAVVGKARQHNIELLPEQVIVQRTGYGVKATIYLEADYTSPIRFPGYDLEMHLTARSGKRLFQ